MLGSMDLERPSATLLLPEWNLVLVVKALSKVELRALVFDPRYLKFRPHDAEVKI